MKHCIGRDLLILHQKWKGRGQQKLFLVRMFQGPQRTETKDLRKYIQLTPCQLQKVVWWLRCLIDDFRKSLVRKWRSRRTRQLLWVQSTMDWSGAAEEYTVRIRGYYNDLNIWADTCDMSRVLCWKKITAFELLIQGEDKNVSSLCNNLKYCNIMGRKEIIN